MTIKRTDKGWLVDIQPGGRGARRFRKTLKTKADALRWEAHVRANVTQAPEWAPKRRDTRRLTELVDTWHELHGQHLRSDAYAMLKRLAKALGNPVADRITTQLFANYRTARLNDGVTANTVNREHAYLRAMFNELARLGHWKEKNPLQALRQLSVSETELTYLTVEQIKALLVALKESRNPDAYLVTRLCLATGARWGEAQNLRAEHVRLDPPAVQYVGTKTDRNRVLPITRELAEEITQGRMRGRLFGPCRDAFKKAVERAGIELPDGQLTHVLRHTFASHFMQGGGNILALQRALGHQDLKMTMRYSHLSPDHLQDVVRLNPLAKVDSESSLA